MQRSFRRTGTDRVDPRPDPAPTHRARFPSLPRRVPIRRRRWTAPGAVGEDPTAPFPRGDRMTESAVPARASSAPVPAEGPFDVEADVVVVGGGGGGLPAALFARWLGDEVVLLEKAPELGGTAKKAAFWYWIPNNAQMQDLGIPDAEEDFLRYVARLSRPQHYDPDSPTFGMNEWEFALCRAIYESASPAAELLRERDALPYRHCRDVPDYWSELPEDKAPTGRVLVPEGARESMSDGGEVGVRTMSAAA